MFFLNLSAPEFFALLGTLGGLLSLLYLLDRSKRRKMVSTLRFWAPAQSSTGQQSRKRVQDPWSFVLQLAALILLLLAIAQLQLGSRDRQGQDHVLLLDSSSWSAQQQQIGETTVLGGEKQLARKFVHSLPKRDRVLVARVSGLATPITAFTSDKVQLLRAINETESDYSALDLDRAFELAQRAQTSQFQTGARGSPGYVVYIGPGMIGENTQTTAMPERLRVISVRPKSENVGVAGIEVVRDVRSGNAWQATVTARNYGSQKVVVQMDSQFGGTHFLPRYLEIPAAQQAYASVHFTASGPGKFTVQLKPGDNLLIDDSAEISLPTAAELSIAVFTDRPQILRPLLEADHRLSARFFPTASYSTNPGADVMIIDGFDPIKPPTLPSLWIDPPRDHAPLPVKASVSDAVVKVWQADSGVSNGLHARETRIPQASIFEDFQGDIPVASVAAGPIVVARGANAHRPALAAIGFDPLEKSLRYEVTTPLLVSHLLYWLAPEGMREREFVATSLGSREVTLDSKENTVGLRVVDEHGVRVPFTLHDHSLGLYASRPSIVRVISSERERVLSMTLPAIARYSWSPKDVPVGMPPVSRRASTAMDLWKYLAAGAALCLALEWWYFGRRRRTAWRRIPLALKICGISAIAIAFFQPHVTMPGKRTAAVILVDTSKSITSQDLDRASNLVSQIAKNRGTNWLRIVPFSSHTRELKTTEISHGVHFLTASNESGNTTNFEEAISDSLAAIPAGYLPRLVLMSDGNDNQGSTARAIAGLRQLHVPVDTIPLTGRSAGGLRIGSISAPKTAYAGEQIPIDLHLEATGAMDATVALFAGGKELGTSKVALQSGGNDLHLQARIRTTGAVAVTGEVNGISFEQAITLTRPRVLVISGDSAESDSNLINALSEAGFDVTRTGAASIETEPAATQLIVLNNLDLNQFSLEGKQKIAGYVRKGGGLLLIGGEHQVYKEDKKLDVLDEALPAKLAPPKTPEGTCVALIIDKSSSMEGRKIELARLSAIGVVEHLRPIDTIGVLIFDNSFQWAVPMRKAEDKSLIKRLIVGIVPDGGTQIAPALTEAYHKVVASPATYKHVVLMTDGISEEGDSLELAKQAADHQVTISTVGLGQDVNRTYLEKVADVSGGKSYFLNEPQGLEQILLKDVRDYSGSTAVEKPLTPLVDTKAEVLEGVNVESAPALRGYTRFISKPDAQTILSIDPQKKDPLYVRWQFGLGRAAIFTSDAKSRWAQAWVTWPGYDKFWINVSRDLLPHVRSVDADTSFDSADGDLLVTYRISPQVKDVGAAPPAIYAIGPDGFRKPVEVTRVADHVYEGRVHLGEAMGLFRIRPLQETEAFPETGYYRQSQELRDYGNNEAILKQISGLTGGRFDPAPSEIFDSGGRVIYTDWQLWPLMLGLAIALTLAELILRKWSGLVAAFH